MTSGQWVTVSIAVAGLLVIVLFAIHEHQESSVSKARAESFRVGYECGVAAEKWRNIKPDKRTRTRPPLLPMGDWETTEKIARESKGRHP